MALSLFIMRHGEAEMVAASDSQRPLTALGKESNLRVAQRLAQAPIMPERLVASPYLRAQQTAEIVRQSLGLESVATLPIITPDDPLRPVIDWLDTQSGSVMLVSHMPLVAYLCAWLLDARPVSFMTSEVRHLELDFVAQGCARLQQTWSADTF
ncbi:phosphohistidine phosphatase SixA [Pokkaliibacter sp. CJK22405]|uniref:phosphohistidine phosphatase SixA n=1 Tax=Pokkaliibacter sp. CJK22405 TaxID=3384615 RepID=UPI00398523ED